MRGSETIGMGFNPESEPVPVPGVENLDNDELAKNPAAGFFQRLKQREEDMGLTDIEVATLPREEIWRRLEANIDNSDKPTPLIVTKLENGNTLLQKDETSNPTESHYDRIYLRLLKQLEETGEIKPGMELLEVTSGSAGVSFAWMCKKLGYTSRVFIPDNLPEGRKAAIGGLATNLEMSKPGADYLKAANGLMVRYGVKARMEAKKNGEESNKYFVDHSNNPISTEAASHIMEEAANQLKELNESGEVTNTKIDNYISGLGNGVTTYGPGKLGKELFPGMKVIGFEPDNASLRFESQFEKVEGESPEEAARRKEFDINQANFPQFKHASTYSEIFKQPKIDEENKEIKDKPIEASKLFPGITAPDGITFPLMDAAFKERIIDTVAPVRGEDVLKDEGVNRLNENWKKGRESDMGMGKTSLLGVGVVLGMAENPEIKNQVFLATIYDNDGRYAIKGSEEEEEKE